MATYEVSNWADLKSKVASASSSDTVYLTADIDMNAVYSSGESQTMGLSGNCTIDAQGHIIRNIDYTNTNSSTGAFFYSSSQAMKVKNIKIENMIIEGTGAFRGVSVYDSDITMELQGHGSNDVYLDIANRADGRSLFDHCGVTCKGYGNAVFNALYNWQRDNNITFNGNFYKILIAPSRTFIQGNFSTVNDFSISYTNKSVIVATINVGGELYASNSTNTCAIDTSVITGRINDEYNKLIRCTTTQIKSPSYLASKGFPIVPELVGGQNG